MENLKDVNKSIMAQNEFCKEKNYPHFAPNSGNCYRCKRNIYEDVQKSERISNGITTKEAGSKLITGCPHCNYSFCD